MPTQNSHHEKHEGLVRCLYYIFEDTGLNITEFDSICSFGEAVAETISTETLKETLIEEEDLSSITKEIFQNELKKRGELS